MKIRMTHDGPKPFGVTKGQVLKVAKRLGPNVLAETEKGKRLVLLAGEFEVLDDDED